MIQVACAVLAAAVSLMVWVSIKPQDLLTLFPYLMAAVVGVAANLLINLMLTRRRPAANPTDLIPAAFGCPSHKASKADIPDSSLRYDPWNRSCWCEDHVQSAHEGLLISSTRYTKEGRHTGM